MFRVLFHTKILQETSFHKAGLCAKLNGAQYSEPAKSRMPSIYDLHGKAKNFLVAQEPGGVLNRFLYGEAPP